MDDSPVRKIGRAYAEVLLSGNEVAAEVAIREALSATLKMVGNLVREAGYAVLMLGADVPPKALATAARRYRPDVLCLSATMPGGSDPVLVAINEVQPASPATAFMIKRADLN